MQHEVAVVDVWVLVQVVNAVCVEQRGAALDAVHLITLVQQELSQVRAILAGDTRDQRNFFTHFSTY
jgi:hypothetical protein